MGELTKPTVIRKLLGEKNIKLTRRLGQHFLIDGNLLSIMVKTADLQPGDVILEVGAGIGTLTEELVKVAGEVYAVEMDERLFAILRDYFGERTNLTLIHGDAMKLCFSKLLPSEIPLKLVSNLPYNIATPLLLKIFRELPGLTSMVITVQRELAERYLSSPGSKSYGATTVKLNYYCQVQRILNLPPSVFYPPPRVYSCLLRLDRRRDLLVQVDDPQRFFQLIDAAFAQRRKTLANSLSSAYEVSLASNEVARVVEGLGWDATTRAENLTLEDFAKLYDSLKSLG